MLDSFYTETLPSQFKERSAVIGDFEITHSLVPLTALDIQEVDNTEFIRLVDNLTVRNMRLEERISLMINVLDIPYKTYAGFKIKGVNRQKSDLYEMSKGWHFEDMPKKRGSSDTFSSRTVKFVADTSMSSRGYYYSFGVSKTAPKRLGTGVSPTVSIFYKKSSVPISFFLKALTGDSFADILRKLGSRNKYLMNAFVFDEPSRLQCIEFCYKELFKKDCPASDDRYKIQDFCSKFIGYCAMIGNGAGRMSTMFSFRTHLKNYILAKPLKLGSTVYQTGTKLIPDLLLEIDYSEVDEVAVQQPGSDRIFTFKKYDIYNFRGLNRADGVNVSLDSLIAAEEGGDLEFSLPNGVVLKRKASPICNTAEVFYNVLNLYTNFLSGFELNSNVYNLENQSLIGIDSFIANSIYERLTYINQKVSELEDSTSSVFMLRNLALKLTPFDLGTLINKIVSSPDRSIQLAGLANSIALNAKAYNVVKNMKHQQGGTVQIQETQIGRLDPFDVPENANVGLTHNRTITSKTGRNTQLKAPFLKVENCVVVSKEPVYFSASDERDQYIGEWNETFSEELTKARFNGMVMMVAPSKLNYIEFSPYQHMSLARAMAPFPENMAGKRAQMEASHVKQSIAIIGGERPIINSGAESLEKIMDNITPPYFTATDLLESFCLENDLPFEDIKDCTVKYIRFTDNMEQRTFMFSFDFDGRTHTFSKKLPAFHPTFEKSMYGYTINKYSGTEFSGQDIVLHSITYDPRNYDRDDRRNTGGLPVDDNTFNSGLGTGVNLRIGYMTYGSSTIDDAMLISDRLVSEDTLSSVYMWKEEYELIRDEKKMEEFGYHDGVIPAGFNSYGIPEVGTYLKAGSTAVYKYMRHIPIPGSHEVQKVNPTNVDLPPTVSGEVISSTINNNKAIITLVSLAKIEPGDKMAGRYGNKGVVAKIVPFHQMPYDAETGEVLDIVLNPLGIPSRINISQVLEVNLAAANRKQGTISVVTPFQDNSIEFIQSKCEENGVKPRSLIFGETGIQVDGYITTGYMYMYKLMQKVSDRINSIGFTDGVDPTFHQPTGGGRSGSKGQAFGEMENWCLDTAGARVLQHELQTVLSNDVESIKIATKYALENPGRIDLDPHSYNNSNDSNLHVFLTATGIRMEQDAEDPSMISYKPLTDQHIKSMNPGKPININDPKNSLRSPTTFNDKFDAQDTWSWMPLGGEMLHPFWVYRGKIMHFVIVSRRQPIKVTTVQQRGSSVTKNKRTLTTEDVDSLLSGRAYLQVEDNAFHFFMLKEGSNDRPPRSITGQEAIDTLMQSVASGTITRSKVRPTDVESILNGKLQLEFTDNEWFLSEIPSSNSATGMQALVDMFKNYDLELTRRFYEASVNKARESGKTINFMDLTVLNSIDDMIKDGGLPQYIVSCMPIMPIRFRPASIMPNVQQDFDYMYSAIASSAAAHMLNPSSTSMLQTFKFYAGFLGVLGKAKTPFKKRGKSGVEEDRTYVDLRKYFSEKDSGGRIREKMAKKYTHRSGRSVLTPFQDPSIGPDRVGVPYIMAIDMWGLELTSLLIKSLPDVFEGEAKLHINKAKMILKNAVLGNESVVMDLCSVNGKQGARYCYHIKELISKCVSKQVVIFGRQPSLHKFSVRAYYPILVDGRAIQIHPLACKGYNADFDGDTGYLIAPVSEAAQKDAWDKLAIENGIVNPGTGALIVEPSQDILVGLYYATSFKDNEIVPGKLVEVDGKSARVVEPMAYSSMQIMLADLDVGLIKAHDWVTVTVDKRQYISTAGRIAFNNIIPGGFTKSAYKNKYSLPVSGNFFDLRYDGVVTGRVSDPKMQVSANGIFKTIYDDYTSMDRYGGLDDSAKEADQEKLKTSQAYDRSKITQFYQKISEFGFKWSERSGVTFRLDDLKQPEVVSNFLDSAKKVTEEIDRQFQMGLLSERGRKNAVMQIYETISTKKFKKEFISSLGRKNNLFLMYDSKARGSDDQIMQTCGLLGVLQKTKSDTIDIPIIRNYSNGLSSFDLFETSYATRLGLLSTILETSKPGELTRTLIYEFSGLYVSEDSCSKDLSGILVDYKVDGDFLTLNGEEISERGVIGLKIVDDLAIKYAKNFSESGEITQEVFNSLKNSGLPWFDTDKGRVEFETTFPDIWCKLAINRTATDTSYPGLYKGKYVTPETIDFFKETKPRDLKIMTLLNCVSKDGICGDSYGLRYDPVVPARVGDYLGSESAQAIGEPSAQLTMSLFHKGGKAGESIEDGITLVKSALQYANIKVNNLAKCSPASGYAYIKPGRILIESDDGKSFIFEGKVDPSSLLIKDGEYVRVGRQLTKGDVHPLNSFSCKSSLKIESGESFEEGVQMSATNKRVGIMNPSLELLIKIRFALTHYYYATYKANGIELNGRHFEVPAFLQTNTVSIINSSVNDLPSGSKCTYGKVYNVSNIDFYLTMGAASDIIVNNAGAIAGFCYQDAYAVLGKAAYNKAPIRERSTISALLTGSDLANETLEVKDLVKASVDPEKLKRVRELEPMKVSSQSHALEITEADLATSDGSSISFDLDDFVDSIPVVKEIPVADEGVEETLGLEDFFGETSKEKKKKKPSDVDNLNVF